MARQIYKDKAGKRLPSVTTILSRFKESGGLLYWANQAGLDGKTLDEARMPAANAGTIAHKLVEAFINKEDEPDLTGPDEVIAQGRAAFDVYQKWQDMTKVEVRHTEVALVSEEHRFGGMLDAIGLVGNELCILDWKTGSLYADHLLQVAAYKILWEESYPDHPLTGGAHLCRFSRETGDFGHSFFPNIDEETETFLIMRGLYDRVKKTEKRVK